MTEVMVRLDGVTKRYGHVTAIDALTLDVRQGEMFGLIGPDGAGKTTTIRVIGGLLRPDAGRVEVQGRDPVADHRATTGAVGYLSQRFSLYGDLSIDENIAFFAEIHGVRHFEPARDRLLEMTQLTPFRTRRADRLSGGMKQKLALACTLVHEPKVLLLDEPTTGVDPVSRREFWKLLAEFLGRGLTILMATPYLDEAERCTRVALLHDGHLLALDRPSTLQDMLRGQLLEVITATPRPAVDALARVKGVADVQSFGDSAHVRLRGLSQAVGVDALTTALRAEGITVTSVRPIAPSLEDVFIELISPRSEDRGSRPEAGNSQVSSGSRSSTLASRDFMKRTLIIIIVLIVGGGWPARAQTTTPTVPPVAVTLDEAIAQGLANSRHLAEIEARVDAAGFVVQERATGDHPDVAFLGGYTRTNHVDVFAIDFPLRPSEVIYPDIPDNFRTRLDLHWPIYSSGRVDALERAAQAEKNAVGEELESARSDLRLEITRAFWALVTARETESVLSRSLEAINAQVKDLRSRFSSGLIPPNDVSSAEAQASRQQVLAIEAANARGIAEADLRRLTGIETAGRLEPREHLTPPAPAPPEMPGSARVDALIAAALKGRAERRALEDRVSSAEDRAQAFRASGRPQVALGAGYDYARPNPHIFPRSGDWKTSWDVSIDVSWSLWDSGRRGAEQGEALANARALNARIGDFDRQVTFEVRQRTLQLDSSRAAVTATDDEVRAALDAERVVGERYRVGVATPTDVLDAQVARLQAELDRTRAIANVRLAEAQLQRALGR